MTLVSEVMDRVRFRIVGAPLVPGAKLPSIRSLAKAEGVSKSTIVEAYERLVADGTIVARHGTGFFVADPPPNARAIEAASEQDRDVDRLWTLRRSFEGGADCLKPGCGWLPRTWMPEAALRQVLRGVARDLASDLVDYGPPQGHVPLRQQILRRLVERGIETNMDQLMLVESGTQAVDLICRTMLRPGDKVLLDDPCYHNFHALLDRSGIAVETVPYRPDGPDVDAFREVCAGGRIGIYLTNGTVQNPTGACLSHEKARQIGKICDAKGILIVEDDVFADFERLTTARHAAISGLERVAYVGSFSKTLSAGLRCGYVAASRGTIADLVERNICFTLGASTLPAEVVYRTLVGGTYRRHIEGVRTKLADAAANVIRRLMDDGIAPWTDYRGGMYVWGKLPDGRRAADLSQRCAREGVIFAPGDGFSPSDRYASYMRFNIAHCQNRRVFDVLSRHMRASRPC